MASDPGGGEGSWAEDPGSFPGLECGLQHGAGEDLEVVAGEDLDMVAGEDLEVVAGEDLDMVAGEDLDMVAGESSESCYVAGLRTKVTKKSLFKMEMQICKLRDEISKETDPKIRLMKCERLDDCIRECAILQERLEGGTKMVPKVQNWGKERKRETRAQSVRRRENIAKTDIVEQEKPVRHGGADTEGSLHPDITCEGSESTGDTAEGCEPANKGLIAMDFDGTANGAAVQESASCADFVYDTAVCEPQQILEPDNADSVRGNQAPAVNGEQGVELCTVSVNGEQGVELCTVSVNGEQGVELCTVSVNGEQGVELCTVSVNGEQGVELCTVSVNGMQGVELCTVSVNGMQDAEQSAVHTGAGHPGAAEERSRTAPPADRPQYRRLFSNVAGSGNPTQRKNAVRIRYTGPEESIPSRLFIGKVLLKEFMRFEASEVFALIHIPSSRIYDISFKLQYSLDLFWNIYNDTRGNKIWENLQVIPLSKPQVVTVTILFQSEVVALADLLLWLSRQCIVKGEPAKIYDEEDIWNGGYTVKVQLHQQNSRTRHLPHSFYLGSERGICYYPGQPRLCHRCGGRHLAINCSRVKCSLCGQFGHVKEDCTGPVICNLCSGPGHTFRGCPQAEHNKCGETVTEVMEEEQEDITTCVDIVPGTARPPADVHQSTRDPVTKPEITTAALKVPAVSEEPCVTTLDAAEKESPATAKPEVSMSPELQVPAATAKPEVSMSPELQVPAATAESEVSISPELQVPAATAKSEVSMSPELQVPAATAESEVSMSPELQVPAATAEPNVTPVDAAVETSPATEARDDPLCEVSKESLTKCLKQSFSPSPEPSDLIAGTSVEENRFQAVKWKNTRAATFRKVMSAARSAARPSVEITSGRYSALGEEDPETPMEQVPSTFPDEELQEDDPGPSVSTKRWSTTSHSRAKKKKTKKPK